MATGPVFDRSGVGSDVIVTLSFAVTVVSPEEKVATGVTVEPPGVTPRGAVKVSTVWKDVPAATVPRF